VSTLSITLHALGVLVVLAAAGQTPDARAETKAERAGRLTAEGVEAARAGRFASAAVLLEEAYGLDPEPILLRHVARAKERAGDLRGAVEYLSRYLEVAVDPRYREESQVALEALQARLPGRLRVTSAAVGALVEVDGAPAGRTPLPAPVEVTPGEHRVKVAKAGHQTFSRTVEVPPDGLVDVPALLVALEAPRAKARSDHRTLTWVLVGTGAAVLVAGGVAAAVLLSSAGGGQPAADGVMTIGAPLGAAR
jgi:hypothetical protein